MKRSLVIISFAFIFLLSVSVVSAGIWGGIKDLFNFGGNGIPVENPIEPTPLDTGDINNPIIGDTGFDEGGGCEFIEEEEALLFAGDEFETLLNGHYLYLDEDGVLSIDGTYSTPLEDGGSYLVPIPNPECYWEASFNDGELSMLTICPVAEEFVE